MYARKVNIKKSGLCPGFFHGLDAVRAEFHALAVDCFYLHVEVKAAASLDHRVAARYAHLWSTVAFLTDLCHMMLFPSPGLVISLSLRERVG